MCNFNDFQTVSYSLWPVMHPCTFCMAHPNYILTLSQPSILRTSRHHGTNFPKGNKGLIYLCALLNSGLSVRTKSRAVSLISSHSGLENVYFPSIIIRNIIICFRCQNGGDPARLHSFNTEMLRKEWNQQHNNEKFYVN